MFETPKLQEKPETEKETLRWKAGRVAEAAREAFWEHTDNPEGASPYDQLFDSELGKFVRTKALFAVVRDIVPDNLFRKLTGSSYQYQEEVLPIDPARYQFDVRKVGSGSECTVYKLVSLDPEAPTLVVKIDRVASNDVDELLTRGKKIRSEYEDKQTWYREIPDLIPEEMQFIGKNPRGGENALFTIQEYFGTADQIHDLFRGYSLNELVAILERDPELKQSFLSFAHATLGHADTADEVIDTRGDRNIVVIDRPDGKKILRLLDPHAIKYPKRTKDKGEAEKIQQDLDFLRLVIAALETERRDTVV